MWFYCGKTEQAAITSGTLKNICTCLQSNHYHQHINVLFLKARCYSTNSDKAQNQRRTSKQNTWKQHQTLNNNQQLTSKCSLMNTFQVMNEKSAQRRLKHCALAVVRRAKKFCHAADPFLGERDGQNLISWRWSLPLPTNPVWWGLMHVISSYHGNRPTPPAHPLQSNRQYRLQYTALQLSAQCNSTH